jgi:hypothetical protein
MQIKYQEYKTLLTNPLLNKLLDPHITNRLEVEFDEFRRDTDYDGIGNYNKDTKEITVTREIYQILKFLNKHYEVTALLYKSLQDKKVNNPNYNYPTLFHLLIIGYADIHIEEIVSLLENYGLQWK